MILLVFQEASASLGFPIVRGLIPDRWGKTKL